MFLFSLIIFPLVSYFIYDKFKNNYLELNGIPKITLLIGLLLVIIILFSGIFKDKQSYLMLILFWYIGIFIFIYFKIANLQFNNIEKFKFEKKSFFYMTIKLLFLITIFIFYISILEAHNIRDYFTFKNIIYNYFLCIIICGLFYEILDVLKNKIIIGKINGNNYKNKLKAELKSEILKELKN